MRRLLLILPASTYRAEEFIEAAEAVGAQPIVATDPHPLLQMRLGDRFIDLTDATADTIATAASAGGPVDGVLSPDDRMVELAGDVAERLGVAANPPWAVGATRNKASFRRALAGVVPQPSFQVLEPGSDPRPDIERIGPPVVMKPLSRSGSQGVIRVDQPEDAIEVERRIRRILAMCGADPNEPLLIEKFVPGPEVAVEAVLVAGELEVLATFDKPDPLDGPFFEETIYVAPSRLHPEVQAEIHRVVQVACSGLGLVEGPVHAELRVSGSTVVMIEMAARPIGGRCGTALRFGLGDAQEVLLARAALGLGLRDTDRLNGSVGSLMIPIPSSGILAAVSGLDAARAVRGITGVDITAHVGGRVLALPEGDRYLGFAYAAADTPEEVEAALRAAQALITVEVA